MQTKIPNPIPTNACYHCGDECKDEKVIYQEKPFCCNGCKVVYEILDENDLDQYYSIEKTPGTSTKNQKELSQYDYLDDAEIQKKLLTFQDDKLSKITFHLPQIHCSSCIWLLENLYKLHEGVRSVQVNFLKRTASITFFQQKISLKAVVILLAKIGYEPTINLATSTTDKNQSTSKKIYYQLGIAGFCFGNVMFFVLPEYLDTTKAFGGTLANYVNYISLILSFPVLFYSGLDYLKSAFYALKHKTINMDVPISLGIISLFLVSCLEVIFEKGGGYFDSLTGLIFFLLIGKLFQQKTFHSLSFERDYKSYFPIAVTRIVNEKQESIPLEKLKVGDVIVVKNHEIIPADAILKSNKTQIDYSFVTGESQLIVKKENDLIYAGGRQSGQAIELEVIKEVSQSYLTELWNNEAFTNIKETSLEKLTNQLSKYFTLIVVGIAILSGIYWASISVSIALHSFTSVLIIACPCALALSIPFALGNSIRIFGRKHFYLKNVSVVEALSKVTTIVFDKTGTLTQAEKNEITYLANPLNSIQQSAFKKLVQQSNHPLSKQLANYLEETISPSIDDFKEVVNKGIQAKIDGDFYQLGSADFVGVEKKESLQTRVYVAINNVYYGYFRLENVYRTGLKELVEKLQNNYQLIVLSGDNEGEKENLQEIFGKESTFCFQQSPKDKLLYIKKLQEAGEKVLMLGDGLNDSGALQQANVGIAVTENTNNFTPACSAILESSHFDKLYNYLKYSKYAVKIVYGSFLISFLYNFVGLFFAVQGQLSPIIAAILMPVSSLSVVLFTMLMTQIKKIS